MRNRRYSGIPWGAIILDACSVFLSMLLAFGLRYRLQWFLDVTFTATFDAYIPFTVIGAVVVLCAMWMVGAYHEWRSRVWLDHVSKAVSGVFIALVLAMAASFIVRPEVYSRLLLLEWGTLLTGLIALNRVVLMLIQQRNRRKGRVIRRVVIVGAGEVGRRVMRTVVARPDLGYRILGYVDDNPDKGLGKIGRFQGLGSLDNLTRIIDEEDVDEVIITLPWNYHRRILNVLRECARRDVSARLVPDLFQMSLSRVEVSDLGGVPLVAIHEITFNQAELTLKRVIDVITVCLGFILGWPILLIIALAIKLDSPGPVLFNQVRVGKNHREFSIYKFRTMRVGAEEDLSKLLDKNEADGPLFKIRDDPRSTRIGRILRQTSLDELPQIWNVLKGEMSLVGPRPPIPAEVAQYKSWHKQRLSVPPGMTGLWQVSGRSELTFDEMVLLDLYYIENWSPLMDLSIMLRTIPKVLIREGAY
ncbi:MAG: undecaprenyl-phosphate glucose phosphotransferase [Anaerolineae bacterium]|nr:undecaprenyl-phosphate glucose phosphotransferase [Anaerolineae bacterium]